MRQFGSDGIALLDWGVAARPAEGQAVCGDRHLVKLLNDGALLAVVDGLGHGKEATFAAQAALGVLEEQAQAPITSIFKQCHSTLASTRGAVMTVAMLNAEESTLTWLGVGNVEGHLFHANGHARGPSYSALLRGGLVGFRLPPLHTVVVPLTRGDLLVFATDGIRVEFLNDLNPLTMPQKLADRILSQHFKGNDDALVLVVRYLGRRHD
jgi:hypothetical protein